MLLKVNRVDSKLLLKLLKSKNFIEKVIITEDDIKTRVHYQGSEEIPQDIKELFDSKNEDGELILGSLTQEMLEADEEVQKLVLQERLAKKQKIQKEIDAWENIDQTNMSQEEIDEITNKINELITEQGAI